MLTVWRKADSFVPGSAGAAAWIFTIARNLRIDALRRERRNGCKFDIDTEMAVGSHIDGRLTPESQIAATQLEQCVRKAMGQLSNEQLRVIELSFFEEKARAANGEHLQIPPSTVKSRSRLAITRMRRPSRRDVMTTEDHPFHVVLLALVAGTLDEKECVETATHVRECTNCRDFMRAMEHVGGIVLGGLPPTSLADESFAYVMVRIDKLAPPSGPANLDDNSVLLLHAYLDGELDPANALAFAEKVRADTALAAEAKRIEALRRLIRERLPR